MRSVGLTERDVAAWRGMLDATETARALRFVFDRHRVTYIAAHALTRAALSALAGDAAPTEWRFVAGDHGKPTAWLKGRPAPLSFNLSHTDGIVGLAAIAEPGHTLGFDLEALDRKVTLEIADRYFRPEEVAWLATLAETARPAGFLRLWTLKEAFIKATGDGLAQDLSTFWFEPMLPRVHFTTALRERTADWHFEQRLLGGQFVAALGVRRPETRQAVTRWTSVDPAGLLRLASSDLP